MDELKISPRGLASVALEGACPRCAWIQLHYKGKMPFQIPMPGIFNSLDRFTKRLVREAFDGGRKLPDWFPAVGNVRGMISEDELHWNRYFRVDKKLRTTLRGSPDDIFQLDDGSFHIVDYKTAKFTDAQDALFPMYDVQLNGYAHIAESTGHVPISGLSLIYFEPQTEVIGAKRASAPATGAWLEFRATRKKVPLAAKGRIPELLERAREIFDLKAAPRGIAGCENCERVEKFGKVAR
jgi:hypothetical protein